jgi:GT2 family glycosyltransferase
MSAVKEPYFFDVADPAQPGAIKDEARYLALFAGALTPLRGEASPSYLSDVKAPGAIHALIPDAKIIAVLRDPVARTYSAYLQQLRFGESRGFVEVVRDEIARDGVSEGIATPILGRSFYAAPVERYLSLFGSNVLVLIYEDVFEDDRKHMRKLLEFLGVETSYADHVRFRLDNPDAVPRNPMFRMLFASRQARSAGRAVVPVLHRARVAQALLKSAQKPAMDPRARRLLEDVFKPDIHALEDLLDRSLPWASQWKANAARSAGSARGQGGRAAKAPTVSVVIPNLEGEYLLAKCLGSLKARTDAGRRPDVVVVDNGSKDSSVSVARRTLPSVRTIRNDVNAGFAEACNQGARASAADYVLFMNSDVVLTADCLSDLVAYADADPDGAAWQPKLLREDGSLDSAGSFFTRTGFLWHEGIGETGLDRFDSARDVFALKGACLLVRRSTFLEVGGFDRDFFAYFEDSDLCWRLLVSGSSVRFVPACCAIHHVGATTTRLFASSEIDYLSFRNRIESIVKNAGPGTLTTVLPVHVLACLGVAGLFALRGRWQNSGAVLRALATSLRRARWLARKRRAVQALRTRPDRAFLPALRMPMTPARGRRLVEAYLPRW